MRGITLQRTASSRRHARCARYPRCRWITSPSTSQRMPSPSDLRYRPTVYRPTPPAGPGARGMHRPLTASSNRYKTHIYIYEDKNTDDARCPSPSRTRIKITDRSGSRSIEQQCRHSYVIHINIAIYQISGCTQRSRATESPAASSMAWWRFQDRPYQHRSRTEQERG